MEDIKRQIEEKELVVQQLKETLSSLQEEQKRIQNAFVAKKAELSKTETEVTNLTIKLKWLLDPGSKVKEPSNKFSVDNRTNDIVLCYTLSSGKNCGETLSKLLVSKKLEVFPIDEQNSYNSDEYEAAIAKSSGLVIVLSKGCFNSVPILFAIKAALVYATRVILVHDPESCLFPGEDEQPEFARQAGIFHDKAITFNAQYADASVNMILKKLTPRLGKEDIRTRAFLSHKRSSAQGIAGRIFQGLRDEYRIFLDSEADFDLHDLQAIVCETDRFCFILSEGILDSFWCIQELRAAVQAKRKIIIILVQGFSLPSPLPDHLQDLTSIIENSPTIEYIAEFYNQFLEKLKKLLGPSDSIINTIKNNNHTLMRQIRNKESVLEIDILDFDIELDSIIDALDVYWEYPMDNLKQLTIRAPECSITFASLERLSKLCKNLEGVAFYINDQAELKEFLDWNETHHLEYVDLHLDPSVINPTRLDILAKKTSHNLRSLDLSNSSLDASFLYSLQANFQKLERLNISNCPSFEKFVFDGAAFPVLKEISVAKNPSVNSGTSHYMLFHMNNPLKTAQILDFSECPNFDDEGIRMIVVASGNYGVNITSINLSKTDVTDQGITQLVQTFPNLEAIDISGNPQISDTSVSAIMTCNKTLRSLNITGCIGCKSSALSPLLKSDFPNLVDIRIGNIISLDNKFVSSVIQRYNDRLQSLDISQSTLSASELEDLFSGVSLPNLSKLVVGQSESVGNKILKLILDKWGNQLMELDVSSSQVTAEGISSILKSKLSIQSLNLKECRIPYADIKAFQKEHPDIRVLFDRPLYLPGKYKGYYVQYNVKTEMVATLNFTTDKHVTGQGVDEIGEFVWTGSYDDKRITMTKQYIGMHSIDYDGEFQSFDCFSGLWMFEGVSDPGNKFLLVREAEE